MDSINSESHDLAVPGESPQDTIGRLSLSCRYRIEAVIEPR